MAVESHEPVISVLDGKILESLYAAKVDAGSIENDRAQLLLVRKLDRLLVELENTRLASKQSALGWLFSSKEAKIPKNRGVYIWGSVGRGKTLLMDMFFDHAGNIKKRRIHFHDFMQDVHTRIHAQRQLVKNSKTRETDPIPPVARALAREAKLLCFDEFSVTDVADAMILSRLFTIMFEQGVTVVVTSNVSPDGLYPHGLNRKHFLSFVELLKQNVETFWLDARTDFRLEKLAKAQVYILEGDCGAQDALNRIWQELTGTVLGSREALTVKGRLLAVPQASLGAARFTFQELCGSPLAAVDYLALAKRYHSVFIDNIPQMNREQRNEAKRFIILIDTLYDHHVNLLCTAAAEPHSLYTATSGVEHFEFGRTSSRLIEMQSHEYLEKSRSNHLHHTSDIETQKSESTN